MRPFGALNTIVDILMPSLCPICGSVPLKYPVPVCPGCEKDIADKTNPVVKKTRDIELILSCAKYEGKVKDAIKHFKYRQVSMINIFTGTIEDLVRVEKDFFSGIDLIVPVPMHPERLRKRGYDQNKVISAGLSRILGVDISRGNLVKIRDTPPQTALCRAEREKNLTGAFGVVLPEKLSSKALLLVDDVTTTGATLRVCAEKLMEYGVSRIKAFTLAYTP